MGESGLLGRPFRKMPERESPQDGIREFHRSLEPGCAHELHRLAHGRICGNRIQVAELVCADPQSGADRRIELAHGTAANLLEHVVERACPLHCPVRDPLRERAVARVQAGGRTGEGAVGVRVLLEDAQDDVVRDSAGRCDHVSPRMKARPGSQKSTTSPSPRSRTCGSTRRKSSRWSPSSRAGRSSHPSSG